MCINSKGVFIFVKLIHLRKGKRKKIFPLLVLSQCFLSIGFFEFYNLKIKNKEMPFCYFCHPSPCLCHLIFFKTVHFRIKKEKKMKNFMLFLALFHAILLPCFMADNQMKAAPRLFVGHPGPNLVDETTRWTKCQSDQNQTIYDFEVETLDGKFTNLAQHKGKIVLLINVATFCAFTQQYLDFNPLLERNSANGVPLTILAFPCNQFHLQEPAENHEILNGVMHVRPGDGWKPHSNLHIYGKLEVNGGNAHPMYDFLRESCPQTVPMLGIKESMFYNPITVSDITWNFEKFLIDANGVPRFRFHPTNWSHGKEVQKFIDKLVAEQQQQPVKKA